LRSCSTAAIKRADTRERRFASFKSTRLCS
jgi:hypothetical protein